MTVTLIRLNKIEEPDMLDHWYRTKAAKAVEAMVEPFLIMCRMPLNFWKEFESTIGPRV